jgi:nitroimidazol reductase NimA-like FMN-containing flavoprotein (pyridoxamine 5'-phosphate oxidase superfamily)
MPAEKNTDSREALEDILREETLGFLGLCRNGEPYVVPLTYAYADGRIIFHCARTGMKLDFLRSNPRVCFTIGREYGEIIRHPQGGSCNADHESVICRGTARLIEDLEERRAALNTFNRRFKSEAEAITPEAASTCMAVEIRVDQMTGRRWGRGKRARWDCRLRPGAEGAAP